MHKKLSLVENYFMKNHQIYATNSKLDISAVSLVSMYNTHVYGFYKNLVLSDENNMNCIIITLQGTAKITLKNGEEIVLPKNSIFFGEHDSMYSLSSVCDHWHFLCNWFIAHNILLPHNKCFVIKDLDENVENSESNKMLRLLQMRKDNKTKLANAYFCYKLLDYLEKINPLLQKSTKLIDKILHYINDHIEENVSVKDIADNFFYSEKHIRTLFKNTLGTSPKQYITKVKLENICQLMLTMNVSLQSLAEKYSFSSVSHLINSFKKQYGTTPSRYLIDK